MDGAGPPQAPDLDLTTRDVSLDGMEELMERFAEHPIVREVLGGGGGIAGSTRDLEAKLRQVELGSIEDYVAESENLLALDREIDNCDAILGGMEATLEEFQGNLCSISQEIRSLQEQSMGLSHKLTNRKIKSVATDQNLRGARALRDVEPELELLRVKAVSKAREFVAQRIYDLRRPKTNVQIQQQTRMLKF